VTHYNHVQHRSVLHPSLLVPRGMP
jgi:hypothetical protein